MENWKELEFHYAELLRNSNTEERRRLYFKAYSEVSKLAVQRFKSDKPEDRTAGTSKELVQLLTQIANKNDRVLEVGCGRGYTCLNLAPRVMSMIGTEIAESSIIESKQVLSQNKISNVEIMNISAFELTKYFDKDEFDLCISIDVVEHLHPDDANEHLEQVFHILKPGGKYVIIMPNRLNGPHDVTKDVFPDKKEAMGFHLNESTYKEMTTSMRVIGFKKLKVIYPLKMFQKGIKAVLLPWQISIASEFLYSNLPKFICPSILNRLIPIRLIAYKATNREGDAILNSAE